MIILCFFSLTLQNERGELTVEILPGGEGERLNIRCILC